MKSVLAKLDELLPSGVRVSTNQVFQYEDYACVPIATEKDLESDGPSGFLLSGTSGEVSLVMDNSDTRGGLWGRLVDAMRKTTAPAQTPPSAAPMPTEYWYG